MASHRAAGIARVVPFLLAPWSAAEAFAEDDRATLSMTPKPGLVAAAAPVSGSSAACVNFKVTLLDLGFFDLSFDIADEGWVWVNRANPLLPRYQSVSGVVTSSGVARNDTPSNHNSHDQNAQILVDPGQEHVLSNVNPPNDTEHVDSESELLTPTTIEMEWEMGTRPEEKSGDGAAPTFPKWAWPSVGDRVWTDGNWVFDCGHEKQVGPFDPFHDPPLIPQRFYRSEIHPARAIASMRSQSHRLPGTGTTPVPVTATDLYVHGRGGYVVEQLNCGMGIIVDGVDEDGDGDGDGDPDACPVKTTPIDENFTFEICLPPRPSAAAVLASSVELGPVAPGFNAITSVAPQLVPGPASAACGNDGVDGADLYDLTTSLHVTVPLAGSGAAPQDVYARVIRAGWVFPPDPPLRRFRVKLDRMDLHNDTDDVPGDDGELTFFWVNVDRAGDEWSRIVDFEIPTFQDCTFPCPNHTNTMNDYDDDGACCFGELDFSGPVFDFYVRDGQPFTIRAQGYDQDCYDFHGNFGDHNLRILMYVGCHTTDIDEFGNNDAMTPLPSPLHPMDTTFGPPDYGVGSLDLRALRLVFNPSTNQLEERSEYDLELTVEELPNEGADTADLKVAKTCAHPGEVALTGEPFTCTITVENLGPGLPRNVRVTDTVLTAVDPSGYSIGSATFTFAGNPALLPCEAQPPSGFRCDLGTVPIGSAATITVEITPLLPGDYTDRAAVASDSADPVSANDQAEATVTVFQRVQIDIEPGSERNPVQPGKHGVVPLAILTTPEFNALSVDVATVCFGDAEAPADRDCHEEHGRGHPEDVDADGDVDLVMHFEAADTGIDPGDDHACLIGRTFAGTGFYGCDLVWTH